MKSTHRTLRLFVAITLAGVIAHLYVRIKPERQWATIPESSMRKYAVDSPSPGYPEESLQRRIGGVSVLDVWITPHGRFDAVTLLEAPDGLNGPIGVAMRAAAWQWKFRPLVPNNEGIQTMRFNSRLTFYFDVNSGAVLSPAEKAARLKHPAHTVAK